MDPDRAMSCEEVRRELVALLDHELEEGAAGDVRSHIEGCPACRAEVASLQATRVALTNSLGRSGQAVPAPGKLWPAIDDPADSPRRRSASREGRVTRSAPGGRRRRTMRALVAAGAAALGLYLVLPQSGSIPEPAANRVAAAPGASVPAGEAVGGPPVELRSRPDMFVDFVIVRRLEKLEKLPELLRDAERNPADLERT